ncbi:tRNA (adenosine(37)-N6)-dimethylallyltransferase MiaA [Plebeiibacterium sediminum]|uniref:tRNA dimethylallyltransferase n=1 Tax=Plebeiibacterium sediminum TaxID=2992112 RepID=A0AAE3M8P7_9BACT|nr:tRNA (adenosine(37)-N6)-dimethylallyltransferase MiaA [Plebeiobacterium sediminum]MCW3789051.1 tRNA (adenosine(37)-N6)-dimethylallyltransferase MiaA [Plebeiobacterium sediminum]
MQKFLIVVVGPTGIGKTKTSIEIAKHYNTEIISADSRQIFKELKIGTATPTEDELKEARHHNIGSQSIHDYYSAWEFEQDALRLSEELFKTHDQLVLTGGSMLYIDAICKGIDELPTIDQQLREDLKKQYETEGIESIRRLLKQLDPVFYEQVDLMNHKRVIHAVEICLITGKTYSSLRTNTIKKRPFHIIKVGLELEREEVYNRINLRVDQMIKMGLVEEARQFYPYKELNSLNTVGYKEIFAHFDGEYDLDKAIELIKRNTRRYAKKQLTWFKKDSETKWFKPTEFNNIISHIDGLILNCKA